MKSHRQKYYIPVRHEKGTRFCKHCKCDISHTRSDCYFCSKTCWARHARSSLKGTIAKLYNSARNRAAKKKIDFNLTQEYLYQLWAEQNGLCAISGIKMETETGIVISNPYKASLDRIDSSKGYTMGNVQLVCGKINLMKHQGTLEDLLFWCSAVVENQ